MLGSATKAMHFLLVLFFWRGVNTGCAPSQPTEAVFKAVISEGKGHVIKKYEILKRQSKEFSCEMADIPSKPQNVTGYWKKNGAEIENSQQTVNRTNEKYILSRNITIEDLGNYSCIFSFLGIVNQATFVLKVPVIKERDKPIVSYIGDSVVLQCEMCHEKKTWEYTKWEWYKVNGTEKEQINVTVHTTKYMLNMDTNVTKLTVLNLTKEDAGKYVCSAVLDIGTSEARVELKVLSFTEPLKPFLAIAVEVLILVTLILLYERQSRSRQRASETTENGPQSEQTNKLTQDESNGMDGGTTTRQRKVEQ
ncbi:embigin [Salminus brasiliensis]|uniref:embigin n=1 Tax=Salminus brasiliensis TaxID=930266 RepID=UPI003B832177